LTTFASPQELSDALLANGYLPDAHIAQVAFLAMQLDKPVLAEGPAGVGKTELAKALATITDRRLIRLQCYEGLDEAKALYEWDYRKQLLRIQAEDEGGWDSIADDIFSEGFLLERPLLSAIRADDPVVLLIDEIDRVEIETEALLLEILSDFQVTIPELGTMGAASQPLVVLTSNNTRELSDALKRRCLFLHIDYPSPERERDILLSQIPDLPESLASGIASAVATIREAALRKPPSVAESIDWARTLLVLGVDDVDERVTAETLSVLLKYQTDIDKVAASLSG